MDVVKHNAKVFIYIAEMIEETPYGTINFTLRMHNGFVVDIMEQNYKRTRFPVKKS